MLQYYLHLPYIYAKVQSRSIFVVREVKNIRMLKLLMALHTVHLTMFLFFHATFLSLCIPSVHLQKLLPTRQYGAVTVRFTAQTKSAVCTFRYQTLRPFIPLHGHSIIRASFSILQKHIFYNKKPGNSHSKGYSLILPISSNNEAV